MKHIALLKSCWEWGGGGMKQIEIYPRNWGRVIKLGVCKIGGTKHFFSKGLGVRHIFICLGGGYETFLAVPKKSSNRVCRVNKIQRFSIEAFCPSTSISLAFDAISWITSWVLRLLDIRDHLLFWPRKILFPRPAFPKILTSALWSWLKTRRKSQGERKQT